jgi:hypothetical protein
MSSRPARSGSSATRWRPRPAGLSRPGRAAAEPGYAGRGNKFDVDRFDPAYLVRLKRFLTEANEASSSS